MVPANLFNEIISCVYSIFYSNKIFNGLTLLCVVVNSYPEEETQNNIKD